LWFYHDCKTGFGLWISQLKQNFDFAALVAIGGLKNHMKKTPRISVAFSYPFKPGKIRQK
jgi:hypothetical protein